MIYHDLQMLKDSQNLVRQSSVKLIYFIKNNPLQFLYQVFGVVGNPVAHSKSPALHNAALMAAGINAVYIPYLVDNLDSFLKSYSDPSFKGFSVTIPHKV